MRRGHLVLVKAALRAAVLCRLWAGAALAAGLARPGHGEPIERALPGHPGGPAGGCTCSRCGRWCSCWASSAGCGCRWAWALVVAAGVAGRQDRLADEPVRAVRPDRRRQLRASSGITSRCGRWSRRPCWARRLLAAAWSLARVREGSVVEALARPLSARELSALVLVGAGAALAFAALDAERRPRPTPSPPTRSWPATGGAAAGDRLPGGRAAPAAARLGDAAGAHLGGRSPGAGLARAAAAGAAGARRPRCGPSIPRPVSDRRPRGHGAAGEPGRAGQPAPAGRRHFDQPTSCTS